MENHRIYKEAFVVATGPTQDSLIDIYENMLNDIKLFIIRIM